MPGFYERRRTLYMKNAGAGHIVVFMTAPNPDAAAVIGERVVEEGLAACCNVIAGLKSIYVWKGKVCKEDEALAIFKTRSEMFGGLKKRIKELHGYEVPEIIAVEIKDGLKEYLDWIDENTAVKRTT